MKLSRRRKSTTPKSSGLDEEQGSEGKGLRHYTVPSPTRRRDKDTGGGWKSSRVLSSCLLACLLFVIGGSFLILSRGNHSDDDKKSTGRNLPVIQKSQTEVSTTETATTTTTTHSTTPIPNSLQANVSSCSCWNSTAPLECCERTIFRAHKFGTFLVDGLFDPFLHPTSKHRIFVGQYPKNSTSFFLPTCDYRHVAVTRNWHNAIVSGYLYHKAGYECWMNARGERKRIVRKGDWESQLTFSLGHVPPRNNRSICQYLEQESEEDGMRVVIDIAVSKWYKGVVPYWKLVQERMQHDSVRHSLFVCYEDLVDPFQQEAKFHQVIDWMLPAGEVQNVSIALSLKRSLEEQQRNQAVYSGDHATEHDPELRARLRRLVERLDSQVFNNTVAFSDALFGCGKEGAPH